LKLDRLSGESVMERKSSALIGKDLRDADTMKLLKVFLDFEKHGTNRIASTMGKKAAKRGESIHL
jgi:hypothetical protein